MSEAKSALDNLYGLFQRLGEAPSGRLENAVSDEEWNARLNTFQRVFRESMDDDLNTPRALAECQQLRTDLNQWENSLSPVRRREARDLFLKIGEPLGLFQLEDKQWVSRAMVFRLAQKNDDAATANEVTEDWIETQIQQRGAARENKNFSEADRIRKTLAAKGITLEDRPDGTTRWKR